MTDWRDRRILDLFGIDRPIVLAPMAGPGTPQMTTWVLHEAADGTMMAGIWECTPGSYHATYTAYEYVVLIEGRITITPDGGTPVSVVAGDAFVVEKDFKGTWVIEEKVRKHFDFRLK